MSPAKPGAREAAKEAERLREEIHKHDHAYYALGNPTISDTQYDKLLIALEALEAQFPQLATPDSPTRRIGDTLTEGFQSVRHAFPMLSLSNAYTEDELREFDVRVRKGSEQESVAYSVELKIDGVAVSLAYENGRFARGVTRGDGVQGDDVTANLRTLRALPLRLRGPAAKASFEARGEVYMERPAFDAYNRAQEAAGGRALLNPRNGTSGSLKLLDPREVAKRPLTCFLYSLMEPARFGVRTQSQALEWMRDAGLRVNPHARRAAGIEEALEVCREWAERRATLGYDTDGMVIKVDEIRLWDVLGTTSKSPRWGIAYKYGSQDAVTTLRDVIFQVGRMGHVTPVALLEPVELLGTTIARATLHNFEEVARKDLRIGDRVVIEKGGEVIPQVVRSIPEERKGGEKRIVPPKKCPSCGTALVQEEGEVALRCENPACPMQLRRRLEHFGSRGAMDIAGLGESTVEQLAEAGMVEDVGDLYALEAPALLELEGFAEKSATALVAAIGGSTRQPWPRVLYALGVEHVGGSTAELLAEEFPGWEELTEATPESLAAVKGIGPVVAEAVHHFVHLPRARKVVEKLRRAGVQLKGKARVRKSASLEGKTLVLTGTLPNLSRAKAEELIKAHGGTVSGSVSRKTHYVVAGESAGSKLDKARELGVAVLSEDTLLELLGETP